MLKTIFISIPILMISMIVGKSLMDDRPQDLLMLLDVAAFGLLLFGPFIFLMFLKVNEADKK